MIKTCIEMTWQSLWKLCLQPGIWAAAALAHAGASDEKAKA